MRSCGLCNLSEIVVRPTDTLEALKRKARIATIFGTLQTTMTQFVYLRPVWQKNAEEEALLGVSMTGIMDHYILSGQCTILEDGYVEDWSEWQPTTESEEDEYEHVLKFFGSVGNIKNLPEVLEYLKQVTIDVNKEWAARLGIKQSAAITAVKPSGTVSQLVNSASGIHPRFSEYYIRTVRADAKDPLAQMMVDMGFPVEDCAMKGAGVKIFSFPIQSPKHGIKVTDICAMDQLKLWKIYQDHWCEHKPSITVYYKDHEFLEIGQWLYNNFDDVSGISFLPYDDHTYLQAPYQNITEEEYKKAVQLMPTNVDWDKLGEYELEDTTTGSQELACSGGVCEVVDLG